MLDLSIDSVRHRGFAISATLQRLRGSSHQCHCRTNPIPTRMGVHLIRPEGHLANCCCLCDTNTEKRETGCKSQNANDVVVVASRRSCLLDPFSLSLSLSRTVRTEFNTGHGTSRVVALHTGPDTFGIGTQPIGRIDPFVTIGRIIQGCQYVSLNGSGRIVAGIGTNRGWIFIDNPLKCHTLRCRGD